jgi:cell division protein FtsL
MRLKGRIWIAIWLAFALIVLAWVVSRDTSGFRTAAELRDLRDQRSVLQAEKAALMRSIREAESRAVLIPRARALGLRLPADSEIVILQAPNRERR